MNGCTAFGMQSRPDLYRAVREVNATAPPR